MKNVNMLRRICLLFLLLVATAMNVSAEKYNLWIAGVQVTDDNRTNIPVDNGTVTFVPNVNRLYIKNATITATANNGYGQAAVYSEMPELQIGVQGNSKLISNSSGIVSTGSLEIFGFISGEDVLSINAGTAITMSSEEDNNLHIYNGIKLTLDGTTNYGVKSSNSKTKMSVSDASTEVKVRGLEECFHNLKSIILNDGQIFTDPYGVYVKNGTVYDANGSSVKNEWVTISTTLKYIYINNYAWPVDFVPADYNVTSSTKGVKSVNVDYNMYGKIWENYEGYAGDNLGIRFTVELKDNYKFADDVKAYIWRDGTYVTQDLKVAGATASKQDFVFTYSVPTPEGGAYIRDVKENITAPVIGEEPQWEIATAAGAKAAGALLEANAKEHFQGEDCLVNEIKWFEVGGKELERGDKFQQGKMYGVEMSVAPVSGKQFSLGGNIYLSISSSLSQSYKLNRTLFVVNGDTASMEISDVPGVYCKISNTSAKLYRIFSALPSYLGDVNQDGAITMADANAVVNYFLAAEKPEGFLIHLANVNGDYDDDGNPAVTMADANQIVNSFLSGAGMQEYTDPANGHMYVDLGLSVKWATCNVGALLSYESGSEYDYRYMAEFSWGGAWREPEYKEWWELEHCCDWEWFEKGNSKYNGCEGFEVVSPLNGNSIFLPAVDVTVKYEHNKYEGYSVYEYYKGYCKYWGGLEKAGPNGEIRCETTLTSQWSMVYDYRPVRMVLP